MIFLFRSWSWLLISIESSLVWENYIWGVLGHKMSLLQNGRRNGLFFASWTCKNTFTKAESEHVLDAACMYAWWVQTINFFWGGVLKITQKIDKETDKWLKKDMRIPNVFVTIKWQLLKKLINHESQKNVSVTPTPDRTQLSGGDLKVVKTQ